MKNLIAWASNPTSIKLLIPTVGSRSTAKRNRRLGSSQNCNIGVKSFVTSPFHLFPWILQNFNLAARQSNRRAYALQAQTTRAWFCSPSGSVQLSRPSKIIATRMVLRPRDAAISINFSCSKAVRFLWRNNRIKSGGGLIRLLTSPVSYWLAGSLAGIPWSQAMSPQDPGHGLSNNGLSC